MERLVWNLRHFDELTNIELYEILQLRSEVFVVEQNCVYLDLDGKDQFCFHLTGRSKDGGQLCAYSRIVPPGLSFTEPSIGRILTPLKYRKQNYGKELLVKSIEETEKQYPGQSIRIGAQTYLIKFYNSFGFVESSEPYDEDGIEHVEMLRKVEI